VTKSRKKAVKMDLKEQGRIQFIMKVMEAIQKQKIVTRTGDNIRIYAE